MTASTPTPGELAFLQAMYKEQCDQARQHETLRQQSTTLVFALSGTIAVVSGAILSAADKSAFASQRPWMTVLYAVLGIFVTALAWFGRELSLKHYERNRMHTERAAAYRRELEGAFSQTKYERLRESAKQSHERNWTEEAGPRSATVIKSRAFLYWMGMYKFLMALGVVMTVLPIVLAIPTQ